MPGAANIGAGLGLLLASATASAGVQVRWRAPADACPGEAEVVRRVLALIGEATIDLSADATVQRTAGRWRVDLRLDWAGGHDERGVIAGDCAALADATVVLVAVLAAPMAVAQRLADEVAAPRIEPPAPSPPPEIAAAPRIEPPEPTALAELPAPPPPPPARPSRRVGGFVRVGGVAGFGVLPRADLGLAAAAGGLLRRVRIEAAVTVLPRQVERLDDGRGGALGFAAAGVRGCPRFLGPPLELSLCAGLEAGVVWARSVGIAPARRTAGPWLAFTLGGGLDAWVAPRVALHAGVEALLAPVVTQHFVGEAALAGARNLAVRGTIGVMFAFAQQNRREPEKQRR